MSQRVPSFSSFWNDLETVDEFSTMYNVDCWNTFEYKSNKISAQDYQLDGLNCGGVPSNTTPTLTSVTPTTLRSSLEEAFSHYQMDGESHQNEAGFVPPSVPTTSVSFGGRDSVGGGNTFNIVDTKSWQGGTTTITEMSPLVHVNTNSLSPPPTPVFSMGSSNSSSSSSTSSNGSRKSIGGRRPNKENGISPEEEERRKLRRERNKAAAARCRKRRADHTNELEEETRDLEGKKQQLQEQIHRLKMEKQELELYLETHQSNCHLRDTDSPPDIKPFIMDPMMENGLDSLPKSTTPLQVVTTNGDSKVFTSMGIPISVENKITAMSAPRQRPNSLPISNSFASKNKMGLSEMALIAISTPSNGLTFNYESLMDGGTGLTPITPFVPSCSTQLRNTNVVDSSSPDSITSKIITL